MTELIEWIALYSPGVVALLALGAAALYALKVGVERGIAAGFQAQAKTAELAMTRRSTFEERILTDRYSLVSSVATRLERLATQLNRIRHGQPAPEGFWNAGELVPLTEIFEEIAAQRLVLGEAFYGAFHVQAQLLLASANAKSESERDALGVSWLEAAGRVRAVAEEQFRIQSIRF